MYAQLGAIRFKAIMPTGMDSTHSWSYAEHQVIEGKPLLQHTGSDLDQHNIQVRFHVDYCKPGEELQKLKAEADKHQALPLLFANGTYKGRHVITAIAVTTEVTADDGSLISADVKISLKEFSDPSPLETKKKQKPKPAVKKPGKPRPKAKKEDVPQLTPASKRAGYEIKTVEGRRIAVRQGKNG